MSKTFANKSKYPLEWPHNIPRHKKPESSRFDTTLFQALENVEKEMQLLAKDSGKKIKDIILSSNFTIGDMNPEDAGVCVYFNWDGVEMCYPIDRYNKVEDNLQAIYHVIKAERTKMRHGGFEFIMAEKQGKHALLGDGKEKPWWEVLGVAPHATYDQAKKAFRTLAKKYHPDSGSGLHVEFTRVQIAWEQFKEEYGK